MNATSAQYTVATNTLQLLKQQMLHWAHPYNICCFLDNNHYTSRQHNAEWLLAVGASAALHSNTNNLALLNAFINEHKGCWMFGHISFDLQSETAPGIENTHPNHVGFHTISWVVPQVVLQLVGNTVTITSYAPHVTPVLVWQQIQATTITTAILPACSFTARLTKQQYLQALQAIQQHIQQGDCYEINYCQEFFTYVNDLPVITAYEQLTTISPNPFSAFYKVNDCYALCASPERYLQRKGNQLIAQPIKGTFKRNKQQPVEDAQLKQALYNSAKDRSENVMVVDLVRNDLGKICEPGSVQVTELFGIYTFPQVHQMISTVEGIINPNTTLVDALAATFPMGSMTGAPKHRVLQLTQQYECSRRGLYSGSIGYMQPNGDWDLNVVIRSLLYNANTGYLSYHVGGGITHYSQPELEYEECLLKASAIQQLFSEGHQKTPA